MNRDLTPAQAQALRERFAEAQRTGKYTILQTRPPRQGAPMLTARSLKALLDNLHPATELDLPVTVCECWFDHELVPGSFASVTPAAIILHRVDDQCGQPPA